MNTNSADNSRAQREAQLTALLLGELSANEAVEIRAAMQQDPSLAELHAQLQTAIGLVREAASSPGPEMTAAPAAREQLAPERRARLQAAFKVATAPVEPRDLDLVYPDEHCGGVDGADRIGAVAAGILGAQTPNRSSGLQTQLVRGSREARPA